MLFRSVDYDSIAAVKAALKIPVVANGDIDSPQKARWVLERTKADAVMIGRAAQGNPWIFRQIDAYLTTGAIIAQPSLNELRKELTAHLGEHYCFYGEFIGVRTARKHVGWYLGDKLHSTLHGQLLLKQFYAIESIDRQAASLGQIFDYLSNTSEQLFLQPSDQTTGVFQECWKQVA